MSDQLKPACYRSFFLSQPQHWQPCSKEHHDMVKASPSEWPGYEVQELYAIPADQVLVPRELLARLSAEYAEWEDVTAGRDNAVSELRAILQR
ncbi:hypothetical protein D3C85_1163840 [compost metagenome]